MSDSDRISHHHQLTTPSNDMIMHPLFIGVLLVPAVGALNGPVSCLLSSTLFSAALVRWCRRLTVCHPSVAPPFTRRAPCVMSVRTACESHHCSPRCLPRTHSPSGVESSEVERSHDVILTAQGEGEEGRRRREEVKHLLLLASPLHSLLLVSAAHITLAAPHSASHAHACQQNSNANIH